MRLEATSRQDLEASIRTFREAGEHEAALEAAIRGYGAELLGFLAGVLQSVDDARDVFSDACEDLWRGLPGFRAQASFRTWAYVVTRNALHRYLRARRQRHWTARTIPAAIDRARTATPIYLQTAVKQRVLQLRAQLSEEERELLVLRVDRAMSWTDLALILADPHEVPTGDSLGRMAAAHRKRFERVKERLRELARREGLLD